MRYIYATAFRNGQSAAGLERAGPAPARARDPGRHGPLRPDGLPGLDWRGTARGARPRPGRAGEPPGGPKFPAQAGPGYPAQPGLMPLAGHNGYVTPVD
jgi:hypothetical protein